MTIRERQAACAYAFVESAKNSIYVALCVIGNLQYNIDRNIHTDLSKLLVEIGKVSCTLEAIVDANTDLRNKQPTESEASNG